jgi:transglutaminase-like putative cysteine protease
MRMKTTKTTTETAAEAGGGPVVIAHAYRWHEAQMAVAMLRAAGIPADAAGSLIHNMMPQAGLALGGVRLMVPAQFRDEALELLASVAPPPARMRLGRAMLFAVLVWWCGAAPMMSGLYLRRPDPPRPEIARAAA